MLSKSGKKVHFESETEAEMKYASMLFAFEAGLYTNILWSSSTDTEGRDTMPNVAWDLITEKCPLEELEGHSFPTENDTRLFETRFWNGDCLMVKTVRARLFETEDRLVCFRFKWHGMGTDVKGSLISGGLSHWIHLGIWLLRHELSQGHVRDDTKAWNLWHLSTRIQNKQNCATAYKERKETLALCTPTYNCNCP